MSHIIPGPDESKTRVRSAIRDLISLQKDDMLDFSRELYRYFMTPRLLSRLIYRG